MLGRVTFEDKLFFTKNMAMMITAGIPIVEALETSEDQTKSKKFKSVVASLLSSVEKGDSFSDALRKHEKVFGMLFVSLASVGDESGTLEESFNFLSDQMTKDNSLRKKVKSAMFYPGLILTAVTVMGTFIAFFILPRLITFFEDFDIELPLSTRVLLFVARIFQDYGVIILPGLLGLLVALVYLYRLPGIKRFLHRLVLKIPLLGNFIAHVQIATLTRNLGVLVKSGVPLNDGIQITAETLSNSVFKKSLLYIGSEVEKGKNISEALADKEVEYFPPIVVKMLAVGEKTGKLDETLIYLSDFFEEEIDNVSKNLSTIIEPALLIFIGVVVAFVALAVISPIYELTGSIRQN